MTTDKCSSDNPVVQKLFAASESFADDKPQQQAQCCVCKTQEDLIFVLNDWICRKHDQEAEQ